MTFLLQIENIENIELYRTIYSIFDVIRWGYLTL